MEGRRCFLLLLLLYDVCTYVLLGHEYFLCFVFVVVVVWSCKNISEIERKQKQKQSSQVTFPVWLAGALAKMNLWKFSIRMAALCWLHAIHIGGGGQITEMAITTFANHLHGQRVLGKDADRERAERRSKLLH